MKTFDEIKSELRNIAEPKNACEEGLEMWNDSKDKVGLIKTIVANWRWVIVSNEIIDEGYLLENFTIEELTKGGLYYKEKDIDELYDFWSKSIQLDGHYTFDNRLKNCPEGYRLPTCEEFCILVANTTYSFKNECGVFEFKNGKELMISAAGFRNYSNDELYLVGQYGKYWSGSPNGTFGYYLIFTNDYVDWYHLDRRYGLSVLCVPE